MSAGKYWRSRIPPKEESVLFLSPPLRVLYLHPWSRFNSRYLMYSALRREEEREEEEEEREEKGRGQKGEWRRRERKG